MSNKSKQVYIDGYKTSRLGLTVNDRCRNIFCNKLLYGHKNNKEFDLKQDRFYCCQDCREEDRDYNYVLSCRNRLIYQRSVYKPQKNRQPKTEEEKIAMKRKRKQYQDEYDRKRREKKRAYYLANKEKIKARVNNYKLKKKQNND
jgi:hypothetical protein